SATILSATQGDVVLQQLDTSAGSISLANGVGLSASSTNPNLGGRLILVIGSIPGPPSSAPVVGVKPANLTVNDTVGGNAYFCSGFTVSTASTANIAGGALIVESGTRGVAAITLAGNNTLQTNATAPVLASLDLSSTNATYVKNTIIPLQQQGRLGGLLSVDLSNNVTGTVTMFAVNYGPSITAMVVPTGVTVTNRKFSSTDTATVALSGSSSTTQVIIAGTEQFIGGTGGQLAITNQVGGLSALAILSGGILTSDSAL